MSRIWKGLMVVLVLLPQAHGQEIWRHVDDQGRTRYADRPFPGAVRRVPPGITVWMARPGSPSESRPAQEKSQQATAETPPAQPEASLATAPSPPGVAIVYPAADATVRGTGGELEVRLTIDGELTDGARLSIRLDGAEASWQGEPPELRLEDVWRGEHRLEARLLDAQGSELAVSREVRFFKREPAISATPAP